MGAADLGAALPDSARVRRQQGPQGGDGRLQGPCPPLLEVFSAEFKRGREAARQRLAEAPNDEEAMSYLAKIDTSYLFLQLSTVGKRTGWDEVLGSKRLLEKVLEKNPNHLRAQVARAWMDYVVGTRVPWGTRWVMGGGSRDRGLRDMREAATETGDFYSEVEADFALWEMLMRDGKRDQAVPVARGAAGALSRQRRTVQVHLRFLAAWGLAPGAWRLLSPSVQFSTTIAGETATSSLPSRISISHNAKSASTSL